MMAVAAAEDDIRLVVATHCDKHFVCVSAYGSLAEFCHNHKHLFRHRSTQSVLIASLYSTEEAMTGF